MQTSQLSTARGSGLPHRVRVYEMAADAESNRFERRINAIIQRIHRSRHGAEFFGEVIDEELSGGNKKPVEVGLSVWLGCH